MIPKVLLQDNTGPSTCWSLMWQAQALFEVSVYELPVHRSDMSRTLFITISSWASSNIAGGTEYGLSHTLAFSDDFIFFKRVEQ